MEPNEAIEALVQLFVERATSSIVQLRKEIRRKAIRTYVQGIFEVALQRLSDQSQTKRGAFVFTEIRLINEGESNRDCDEIGDDDNVIKRNQNSENELGHDSSPLSHQTRDGASQMGKSEHHLECLVSQKSLRLQDLTEIERNAIHTFVLGIFEVAIQRHIDGTAPNKQLSACAPRGVLVEAVADEEEIEQHRLHTGQIHPISAIDADTDAGARASERHDLFADFRLRAVAEKEFLRELYEKEMALRIAAELARAEAEKEIALLRDRVSALSAAMPISRRREELEAALIAGTKLQVPEPLSRTKQTLHRHLESASDLEIADKTDDFLASDPLVEPGPVVTAFNAFLSAVARDGRESPQDLQGIDFMAIDPSSLQLGQVEEMKSFLASAVSEHKKTAELLALSAEDATMMLEALVRH